MKEPSELWKIIMRALHSRDGHALKHTHGELTDAILKAIEAAGMVCVPREPTEAAINAAIESWREENSGRLNWRNGLRAAIVSLGTMHAGEAQ